MESYKKTLYEYVLQASKIKPFNTAIYYQGRHISFIRFIKLVDKTADILYYTLGIRKGDVVMISQPNIPETLILFYAVNKIGAIANMVHPFTPYNQIRTIYYKNHAKVAFLFEQRVAKEVEAYRNLSDHIYITRIEDYLPHFKRFFYHTFMNKKIRNKLGKYIKFNGFNYFYKLKNVKEHIDMCPNNSKDVSVMLHSGSTTGEPKTICLNNDSFNFIGEHACEFVGCEPKDLFGTCMLSALPSFHGFGLLMTMHTPLINSFGVALVPKFTVDEVVSIMNHVNLSTMCGIPKMYEAMVNDAKFRSNKHIKNLLICFCGGDSMNVSLKKRFDDVMRNGGSHCQLFEGYGLTEAIAVNCVNTYKHNKEGSIGYPASGVFFKIIDDNENEVNRGEFGEITFKSPANMLHYFNNEEATKATMTHDGYLKTGDIGYMDADGFIFFKQRKKRVIKVSGVGVFPSEIESLIETVPGVTSVCAIQIPDAKLVNAVKVIVVAKFYDEVGMRRAIMDACQKYLIKWSVPKEIEFRDELPYTLLGKVDFVKLQKEEDEKRKLR